MPEWMSGLLEIALLSVLGLSALLVAAVLYTLMHRILSIWRDWRRMRRRSVYYEQAELLAAGEVPPREFVRAVHRRDYVAAEDLLLEVTAKFTGEVRTTLSEAFVALGAVERNRKRCHSRLWWERADAARRLGLMAEPNACRSLHALLKDPNVEVRIAAARALIGLGSGEWLAALIDTFDEETPFSTLRLADVVLEAGPAAVPALIAYVQKAEQPRGAAVAIDILGDMRAHEAEPVIRQALLRSPSVEVRAACCRALGRIESPDAVDALLAQLEDPAWVVRSQAVRALGQIGDPEPVPHIVPLLQADQPWLIYNAALALWRMGPAGLQALYDEMPMNNAQEGLLGQIIIEIVTIDPARR